MYYLYLLSTSRTSKWPSWIVGCFSIFLVGNENSRASWTLFQALKECWSDPFSTGFWPMELFRSRKLCLHEALMVTNSIQVASWGHLAAVAFESWIETEAVASLLQWRCAEHRRQYGHWQGLRFWICVDAADRSIGVLLGSTKRLRLGNGRSQN